VTSAVRVLFIHPTFESLGVEYLAAAVRWGGHAPRLLFDPRLFDDPFIRVPALARAFDRSVELPRRAAELAPGLICFSVVAADYAWALRVAGAVKAATGAPVVFGGVHPSAAPGAVLENPQVDYVVVGEGEAALVELADALAAGGDPAGIPNLCLRADGAVVRNPPRPLLRDLDTLPFPDKALFYGEAPFMARHYTLSTRRGCAARCSYCHNSMWPRIYGGQEQGVRLRSVDSVLQELSLALTRQRFSRVRINDDLFSHDTDWLVRFCRRYRREIGKPFMCSCAPDGLTRAVAAELKAAGCFQVCLGVQSPDARVRQEQFCRHTPQQQVVEALAALREVRLRSTVDNILGYPGQGARAAEDLARFYLDNPVYGRYTIFWLIHYPGTALTEAAVARGELTPAQAARLERAPEDRANTLTGAAEDAQDRRRQHLLLVLAQLLPRPAARWLLRRGRINRLPTALSPALLEAAWTVMAADRLDPERRRYYAKYLRFGWRTVQGILGGNG